MDCSICKSNKKKYLYPGIVRCLECGLVFYEGSPCKEELEQLYQDEYFKGEEYLDYKNDKKIIQMNFSRRLNEIIRYISKGNLFEIGSAYGFFLDLSKKYFDSRGIDITENPAKYANEKLGVNVENGEYLDFEMNQKKDIFCMWDTIEHLSRPDKYIEKIGREIKTGGYLFLTTGDIGSWLAKISGKRWRIIHPPTHLFYFSRKTIEKLLKNYGFEVVEITYPGIYRSLKQIFYSLFFLNKKKLPRILEIIFNKLDIPIYINTFDIMMVVAIKK